jgi:hypothetical protein
MPRSRGGHTKCAHGKALALPWADTPLSRSLLAAVTITRAPEGKNWPCLVTPARLYIACTNRPAADHSTNAMVHATRSALSRIGTNTFLQCAPARTHRGHAMPIPHEPQPRTVQHASCRHILDHEHPHYTVTPRTPHRLRGQGTALRRDLAECTTPALLAIAHAHGVGKRTHASLPEHTVWPPPVTAVMAPRTCRCRCSSMHAVYTHAARSCHNRCRTRSAPGPYTHSTLAVTVRRALP